MACKPWQKFWRPLHPKNFTPDLVECFEDLEVFLLIRRKPCAEFVRVMAHYTRIHTWTKDWPKNFTIVPR